MPYIKLGSKLERFHGITLIFGPPDKTLDKSYLWFGHERRWNYSGQLKKVEKRKINWRAKKKLHAHTIHNEIITFILKAFKNEKYRIELPVAKKSEAKNFLSISEKRE